MDISTLPNPLVFYDGTPVKTVSDWQRRRKELMQSILDIEYGELPPQPVSVRAELLHRHIPVQIPSCEHQQYRIITEGGSSSFWFVVDMFIPKADSSARFPVVITGDGCWLYVSEAVRAEVLSRGYILVVFNRTEIVPDEYSPDRNAGLYLIYPQGNFGAISAWAWGYHRVVDFLFTHPNVNTSQIAIVGHSRGGKTVLLAGATDERIALTAPNNSGCCGAGCFRILGEGSETLAYILNAVPYWFSKKLVNYIGRENELPFDQHSLKALLAPRLLLSTEALDDLWANPKGTFATYLAAKEVYRFLGVEDKIGIYYRHGGHNHGIDDWKVFLDFADMHFLGKPSSINFDKNPFLV